MAFELPELPYGYADLEPHYDEATLRLHHDMHHAAYVKGLNAAGEKLAAACAAGKVRVGEMFVTAGVELDGPRWIINFPTKQHWRHPSKLEWVQNGLVALKAVIREKQIQSIAIPPLGCGNGGLDWGVVRPLIEATLNDLSGVEVLIFEPVEKYHLQTAVIAK